jgi:hypothetical protein
MAAERLPPVLRLFKLASVVNTPALFVGGLAAAAGERWGAYLLVTNCLFQMGSHLSSGAWAYRDAMSRPWPDVPALEDDEWDE